jgi:sporulation protein YlmC with PRC-barrel domain
MRYRRDLDRNTIGVQAFVAYWRDGDVARNKGWLLSGLAILALAFLLLIVVSTSPLRSQGVQLVQVDVSVVANGYRASKLIGHNVVNDKNEKIGTLDDIIIGKDRILFAVLQVGGFLGLGGHLVAVPYEKLVLDDAGTRIELPGASKDELKKLNEFKYRTS